MKKILTLISYLILIYLMISCVSCSRKIAINNSIKDSIYITSIDTFKLYKQDSIFVTQYIKGDTLFRDKFVYKTTIQYKVKIDTIFKDKIINKEKTITKNVTPTWVYSVIFGLGFIIVLGILLFLLYTKLKL